MGTAPALPLFYRFCCAIFHISQQNPLDRIVSAVKNPSENLALEEFRIPCGQIRPIKRLGFPELRSIEWWDNGIDR